MFIEEGFLKTGKTEACLKQEGNMPSRIEQLAAQLSSRGIWLMIDGGKQSAEVESFGWRSCKDFVNLNSTERKDIDKCMTNMRRIRPSRRA